jgi:hypothetical protein
MAMPSCLVGERCTEICDGIMISTREVDVFRGALVILCAMDHDDYQCFANEEGLRQGG